MVLSLLVLVTNAAPPGCNPIPQVECTTHSDCNVDVGICDAYLCRYGTCVGGALPVYWPCGTEEGDLLYCQGGECTYMTECDDESPCTVDYVDLNSGSCQHSPLVCDDGVFCNGEESCNAEAGCQAGEAVVCDDEVGCTVDACDEELGACGFTTDDTLCDNGVFCDGAEVCDSELDCVDGELPVCDDGVDCTVDACEPDLDVCVSAPDHELCDNGEFCDGVEICDLTEGCIDNLDVDCDDAVDCTKDVCDELLDACVNDPRDSFCDDELWCDGAEVCDVDLGCVDGEAPNCDDGVSCTSDACDEDNDWCVYTADDSQCDNGLWCDGSETCHVEDGCLSGTAPECADDVSCTVDACDEQLDACVNLPSDARCDNDAFCDGVETCDQVNDCQAGVAPDCADDVSCTVDSCDEVNDACLNVASDDLCDDSVYCNGSETCNELTGCVDGETRVCDDGIDCTEDSCSEDVKGCLYAPNDELCDDVLVCNGVEVCSAVDGCLVGEAVNCDDGIACSEDTCKEDPGGCEYIYLDEACNDNDACTSDSCDAEVGCVNEVMDCNDDNACTTDSCSEGVCVNEALEECCLTVEDCDDINECTVDSCEDNVCVNDELAEGCCEDDDDCDTLSVCQLEDDADTGDCVWDYDVVTCQIKCPVEYSQVNIWWNSRSVYFDRDPEIGVVFTADWRLELCSWASNDPIFAFNCKEEGIWSGGDLAEVTCNRFDGTDEQPLEFEVVPDLWEGQHGKMLVLDKVTSHACHYPK